MDSGIWIAEEELPDLSDDCPPAPSMPLLAALELQHAEVSARHRTLTSKPPPEALLYLNDRRNRCYASLASSLPHLPVLMSYYCTLPKS